MPRRPATMGLMRTTSSETGVSDGTLCVPPAIIVSRTRYKVRAVSPGVELALSNAPSPGVHR
jgi:hypothetical protein